MITNQFIRIYLTDDASYISLHVEKGGISNTILKIGKLTNRIVRCKDVNSSLGFAIDSKNHVIIEDEDGI